MAGSHAPGAGNLQPELTSIVGRDGDVARVVGLLAETRMITLTGPGGVGKTRLSREVGATARRRFEEGVWFVDLSEITDPALLVAALMSGLGKSRTAGAGMAELTSFVGQRHLLLILDNCEHLTDACAELATDLLRSCPRIHVLATSREALRIHGEVVLDVPPLAVPSESEGRADAVALFEARAKQLNSQFALDETNAELVAELCRRLDGLPLAIELAAASTRFLSLEQLVSGASEGLPHDVPGSRSAPARHQSLHRAIAYSFDLCSEPARLLWSRLSVFRGGAELDAIEAVCVGDGLHSTTIWRAVCELVDKSVLVFSGNRYRMLGVIQAFGRTRLRESGEEPKFQARHRDFFAALAADMGAGWFGSDQPALLERLSREQANIRAVLERAAGDPAEAETGLRIAVDLYAVWLGGALPGEGRHWLAKLLGVERIDQQARAPALWLHGFLLTIEGEIPAGIEILRQAEQLGAEIGDHATTAHAAQKRGLAELLRGNTSEGRELLERAVHLERAVEGFNPFLVDALLGLGVAYCNLDDSDRAFEVLLEAAGICEQHDEQLLLTWVTIHLGLAAYLSGRFDETEARVDDALGRLRTLHAPLGVSWTIEILAWTSLERGQLERASRLYGAARSLSAPFGQHLSGFPRLIQLHAGNLERTRQGLGRRSFDAAYDAGQRMTKEEIIAFALSHSDVPKVEGADTPPAYPLTPRERQIAELVADGMTNREIAALLVISPRTVDTHVEHILTKLDFGSRSQVAAMLGPRGSRTGRPDIRK